MNGPLHLPIEVVLAVPVVIGLAFFVIGRLAARDIEGRGSPPDD